MSYEAYNCASFAEHLQEFVGETVTIFTTSGGQSGCGFTGVIIKVNSCFCRLITRIGRAPACALGNSCNGRNMNGYGNGYNPLGSVLDIPIDRIASFVPNAV